jgi:hypothetical protein
MHGPQGLSKAASNSLILSKYTQQTREFVPLETADVPKIHQSYALIHIAGNTQFTHSSAGYIKSMSATHLCSPQKPINKKLWRRRGYLR